MKRTSFILTLVLAMLTVSIIHVGAATHVRWHPYNGTRAGGYIFDFGSNIPVVWEYETGLYVTAYEPEVEYPTPPWYSHFRETISKRFANGSGYSCEYGTVLIRYDIYTHYRVEQFDVIMLSSPGPH